MKFKVGDRVEIIGGLSQSRIGTIAIITAGPLSSCTVSNRPYTGGGPIYELDIESHKYPGLPAGYAPKNLRLIPYDVNQASSWETCTFKPTELVT